MRTDLRKVRELLEEYAWLIPLAGNVPRQDKTFMQDLETELLKLGCILDIDLAILRRFVLTARKGGDRDDLQSV